MPHYYGGGGICFSQTKITGIVTDNKKHPISNVLIKTNKSNTYSNTSGFFELELSSKNDSLLSISKDGYKSLTQKIDPKKNIFLPILLETETVQEISELTISIARFTDMNRLKIKNLENPIFSSTIKKDLIEKRNVTSIEDALKSATGITATSRYGGFMSFNIRGFADYAFLIDGLRDERISFSWAPISNITNAERIEVLKGPESVLFGHSVLGGIINVIRKKPTTKLKAEARFDYGSYDTYNSYLGIGGPISKKLRYRVDVGLTRTKGWRDHEINTNNGALILDYTPTEKDAFQFSIQANDDKYNTESGLPTDHNIKGDVKLVSGLNRALRYNHPDDIMTHKRADFRLKYSRKLNENLNLSNVTSYSYDDIFYISNDGGITVNDDKTKVTRTTIGFGHRAKPFQNQVDVTYKFNLGKNITNKIIVGNYISILNRKSRSLDFEGPGVSNDLDLYNPIINTGFRKHYIKRISTRKENVVSFYLQNWLSISEKFKLLLGGRYDSFYSHYLTDNYNKLGEKSSSISVGKGTFNTFTYRLGLVYLPIEHLSIFGSYSTYFKPTRNFDKYGNVYDPEKGLQGELGMKFQQGNLFQISLSGFYILKHNILEKASADSFNRIGRVDSKGFEIDANLNITNEFSIKTGYAYTDARIKEGAKKGFHSQYTPKHLFNTWLDYEFKEYLKGLNIGLGANYVGASYADTDDTYITSGYFLLDGMISYKWNNKIRLGFNLNNILNEKYFSSSIKNYDATPVRIMAVPGMGRNYKISLGYQF